MTGFAQGLNNGFDSNVETAIGRANRRLAAMPLNVSAQGNTATPAVINTWNVEINGEVIDKDGTARPSNGFWPTTTQGGRDAAMLHVHRHRQRLDAGERFRQGHRGPGLFHHRLGK